MTVVISRFTVTSRSTARRLSAPTPASTAMTSVEVRKIFEASRMCSFFPYRPGRAAGAVTVGATGAN